MSRRYLVNFVGSFAIFDPAGRDITPKSNKAKAVVALLCGTTPMRRSRRWLEATLWSRSSPKQASGSLRQVLSELKTTFLPKDRVFEADRRDVWLDAESIETDLASLGSGISAGRGLLEDLELRETAYLKWLAEFRERHNAHVSILRAKADSEQNPPTTQSSRITVNAVETEQGSPAERLASNIITDQVAKGLEERLGVTRISTLPGAKNRQITDLEVRCNVAQDGRNGIVFLQIHHGLNGRILFSGHRAVNGDVTNAISAPVVQGLIRAAITKLSHLLPSAFDLQRPEVAAAGFARLGIQKLTRFDHDELKSAQDHFEKAHETDPNGVYLAWRAFTRMAQLIEDAESDRATHLEEIQNLTADALQTASDNGLALALVALTQIMIDKDLETPATLAQKAVSWNENNLFAQQALAVAHSAVGNSERAYKISKACQKAAPDDEFSQLWDHHHTLVCIGANQLDEARAAALRASKASPNFVAPRRQLIALCAHDGDFDTAREHLDAMQWLEQDFSLDRYLNDPEYPVLKLRRAGLIESLNRGDLEA